VEADLDAAEDVGPEFVGADDDGAHRAGGGGAWVETGVEADGGVFAADALASYGQPENLAKNETAASDEAAASTALAPMRPQIEFFS